MEVLEKGVKGRFIGVFYFGERFEDRDFITGTVFHEAGRKDCEKEYHVGAGI